MSESLQEKRARLRRLLERPREAAPVPPGEPPPVAPRGRRTDPEPLSFAQQGLWFVAKLEGPNPAYNIPLLVRLSGSLDVSALARAISAIVRRQDCLRTRFVERGGVPGQVLSDTAKLELELEPQAVAPEESAAAIRDEVRRPFDVAADGLFRARLFRQAPERHVLAVTVHHGISDAWSTGVFLRELVALYEAYRRGEEPALPPLAVTYADYVHWERAWLERGVLERQLGFWRDQLADLPPPPALPLDRPRPAVPGHRGGTVHFASPPGLLAGLKSLGREQRSSLFATLVAGLGVLLDRQASSPGDVAIGTGVANRRPELEGLIGLFVNTLVLRLRPAAEQPFAAVLRECREVVLQALANQDAPYHRVVEALRPERGAGHSPFFQVMLTLQNVDYARRVELPALSMDVEIPDSGAAKFDLSIAVQEEAAGFAGQIEYRADLFDEATVRRLAERYLLLLQQAVDHPELPVGGYEILTAAERHLLAGPWSGRDRDRGQAPGPGIHARFAERARRDPQATAVVHRDRSWSYGELDAQADRLARHLRGRGVGAETLVGVCVERGYGMIVGLLAVLKAGGAYLPLDPENPAERMLYLLGDAGVELALASAALSASLPAGAVEVIVLDEVLDALEPAAPPARELEGEDRRGDAALAYVMYTSGSTGEPKGVAVEHRAIARLVCDADWIELDARTVTLHHSPVSFDASTFEIWAPLLNGGRLVLSHGEAADVEGLARQVERQGVDTLWLTAGVLPLWVDQHLGRHLALRYLLVGGDVVPERAVREIYAHDPGVVIVNGYGPTENTTFSCCFPVPREEGGAGSLPIGRPIRGTSACVLDAALRLQPIGCAGELYVGGGGLARGYLGRPHLTAERFVPDPFAAAPATRLYRTGDNVRWLASGDLEFLGRADRQVKLRGYRIELAEVEAHLARLPGVKLGAVVARQDRPGERRLVAYVAGDEGAAPEPASLREGLASRLPEYMVPSLFVVLAALPLTENGKVDRAALPAPAESDYRRGAYVAPRTELERVLCGIWEEVLGVERVGVEDSFFELGGHSLLATQVVSRTRAALGRELPLRAMFEQRTIAALCARLPEMGGGLVLPPIEAVADRSRLPLSYAQQRLFFIDRLEGGSSHYNIPGAMRVRGDLDREAVARALQAIVDRHEPLRTVFREVDGEVCQVVREGVELPLTVRDLGGWAVEEREQEIRRLALEDARRPFDLGRDLLLRASLLDLAAGEHVVLLNMHHIASDGWSMGVLMRELTALYDAYRAGRESPLAPLRVQYADYACWQRQWLKGEVLEDQLAYWRRRLAGLPQVHGLPLDRPRPARQGFEAAHHLQRLGRDLKGRIESACRRRGVTLFMFLHAAFAALLSRYSNETDVVVGSPIAGRIHRDLEPLIGFFVNTLVLRSDLGGDPRFVDLLEAGKQTILDADAHQHAPFEMLVAELRPERSLGHHPLFQVLFVLQSVEGAGLQLLGSHLEPVEDVIEVVKFDLEMGVLDREGGLALSWLYKKELFAGATIERLAAAFGALLEGILESAQARVGSLPLLTAAERATLLVEWGGRAAPDLPERCLHELFEERAARAPDAVAACCGELQLSYGELDRRANRLARHLRTLGVGPEVRVGIGLEPSLATLVGLLGILKAGGAYVPLDPAAPRERSQIVLSDAAVAVLVTEEPLLGALPEPAGPVVCLDRDRRAIDRQEAAPLASGASPANLGYVIYTSGSTGRPKGVGVATGSPARHAAGVRELWGLEPGDHVLQLTPVVFDPAVEQIFTTLAAGARLVLAGRELWTPAELLANVRRLEVTIADLPTAYWATVLAEWRRSREAADTLRLIIVGGEALRAEPARLWRESALCPARLLNAYGPTEATITATAFDAGADTAPRGGHSVPIGRALAGRTTQVLDPAGELAPIGVAGELCLGGHGLARGYLGLPGLTAERFVPDPHGRAGSRRYRTGDLVRYQADGNLEFLGRVDQQVKVRGFRVEPGEIEARLRSQPAVKDAVVLAREDRPGEKRLVAYVVGREGSAPDPERLRQHVASRLPDHMVPASFVVLEWLPLLASGKVDHAALLALEDYQRSEYVAPRSEAERRLAAIWEELLGVASVGIDDNFFHLGGHSLLATQVVSRVRSALGWELPLRAVFEHPTIRGFCERLPDLGGELALPPIEAVPRGGRLALSYAQQRLWFIDRLEGGSAQYHLPAALRLRQRLDRAALGRALRAIVGRHESLRTVFREADGEVFQVVREEFHLELTVRDLRGIAPEEREREVGRLALEDAWRPFDLSRDLLLRAGLLELAEEEHVVLLNMHHVASDGWSVGVLMRELAALYEAYRAGGESPLPPLSVQYADYAAWQRRWLAGAVLAGHLAYWRRQLAGLPLVHGLPLDRPRPARQGFAGGGHVQRLGRELRDRIEARGREAGVTLFMFLEAAFAVLLARYGRETDVAVGSPIAGRVHRDVEPLIGFFVNPVVLRSDLAGDPRFAELLAASRHTILDAYAHQHVPFEMLVEELRPERTLSHSPLFQILFALQNAAPGGGGLGGPRLDTLGGGIGIVRFDLELSVWELEEGLVLDWLYKRELFEAETIERLAAGFGVLLEGLLERPQERVRSLSLLTEAQWRRLLFEWNRREAPYPRERTIHELFAAQAQRSPDAVAVVSGAGCEELRLTYRELDERANRLAHYLIALGVEAEEPVGVALERSPAMVAAIVAILKAGGAYLPLDPGLPPARLRTILEDAGVEVVLTASRLAGLGCFAGRRAVPLDDPALAARLLERPGSDPGRRTSAGQLAYVIYTSGSTGQPKGVMVVHRSVVRLVVEPDFVPLGRDTVMLQLSSVAFDAATLEIWGALLNGGRLVLYPERVPEIGELNAQLTRHGVDTLWLTAGLFELWSHQLPRSSALRWVLSGGDVVDPFAVARVHAGLPGVEVIDGYGPTENTTFTSCHRVPRGFDPQRPLPLGRPIHGTGVQVLQEDLSLAPLGAVGELCASGDGLARGYLDRPDLTAERFVPDPYSQVPGSRQYRTGDLARWRVDGTLEFLGRLDGQVKVRGFRVELGEIEAQLRSQAAVKEAMVLMREDRPGEKWLVGYVVPAVAPAGASLAGELKMALQRGLPDYMVPAAFVVLAALPLTANGKVDRGALPAPWEGGRRRGEHVAPRTELERRLCEIWQELLGVERVGIEDSFFDLGGHSLLAARVVSRVRSLLGRELPLRALFEHPTVGDLCERLPEVGGGWVLPPIPLVARGEGLALSFAQQRLWFIDRLEGASSQYNIPVAARIRGELDAAALARALAAIVERHEPLRTVFREVDGDVQQVIRQVMGQDRGFRLSAADLSGLQPEEREREVRRLAAEDARRPFDLAGDLLLRAGLLELAPDEHVMLLSMHHIASDGWSMGVLMRELEALYEAYRSGRESPLRPLSVQYADYAAWQRQWLQGEVLEVQLSYWRRRLADLPLVHNLPLDRPRPAREGLAGGQRTRRLGGELKGRLEAACRRSEVTPFMFLQTVFAVLLGRYADETDVVMGSPIAGRVHRDLEPLIGFFVNTLVLRSDLSVDAPFSALLAAGKQAILDAYAHQHVPFEMLVEELRPERSLSHGALFQILFAFQSTGQSTERVEARLGDARLEWLADGGGAAKFDLELNARELAEGLVLSWWHKEELFDGETIQRLAGHFEVLLAALTGDAGVPWGEVPLLAAAERSQMLVEWNDTGSPVGGEQCLDELFAARAEAAPAVVALIDGERELTYGELAVRAYRLADHLVELGVGPERVVGVCLERTAEMVAALLAVLAAGGAYLPLDPAHPRARLERVLADGRVSLVITQESLAARLPWGGPTVVLERDRAAIARRPHRRPASGARRQNLAYVLFTSGSTGTPKGVAVTHASAVEMILWVGRLFSPADLAGTLAATSLSFDVSVFELFAPLSWGGTAILAGNVLELPGLPALPRVRLVSAVPSAMAELLRLGPLPAGVRTVNLGGEPLSRALAERIWATGTVEALWNLYGPSEYTTYSTFASVELARVAPAPRIGRPIAATRAYLVDRRGQPVPVGVPGELWLAGAGLARGYLGRPDLTAERFIPDPFSGELGARLYRTGDLVRRLPDGELDLLGRIDSQVKVRGFRVELGEIEAALAAHPEVREAAVLAREDPSGDRRLVAYVAGGGDAARLREFLRARLPEHMVPAAFVALDALPRTTSGKLDRKALPVWREDRPGQDTAYLPPRDTLELALVQIWEEVLGVRPVGVQDSFFALGGHSLLAIRLVARIAQLLGRELPVVELFQHPTVEALARRFRAERGARPAASPVVALQAAGHRRPFFCVHPGGGDVLAYVALSRHLGTERPFYGLQALETSDGIAPEETLEAMAARYVAALREVQPAGPYLLGGWSLGGVVAYEMARQLREGGEEIALLALIDARVPGPPRGPAEDGDLALLATFGVNLGLAVDELVASVDEVREMGAPERLAWLLARARRARLLPPDLEAERLAHRFRVFAAHLATLERYRPRRFDGRLTLYRAAGEESNGDAHGWSGLALRGVEIREVPGTHFTLLREPAVAELAARLAADLP